MFADLENIAANNREILIFFLLVYITRRSEKSEMWWDERDIKAKNKNCRIYCLQIT